MINLNKFNGYYLINPEHNATGSNRVDLRINGNRMSVNYDKWRAITEHDKQSLETLNKQNKLISN